VRQVHLSAESFGCAGFRLDGLFLPIFRRSIGLKRVEKTRGHASYFIDGCQKRRFVRFGRVREAAYLAYELERSRPNLLVGHGRIEIEECFDISAHTFTLYMDLDGIELSR
jgi:hypothetical protein